MLGSTVGIGSDGWLAVASGIGFAMTVVLTERVIHTDEGDIAYDEFVMTKRLRRS